MRCSTGPAQRIGLSATVRPVEEVARFLAGGRPVTVVQPPSTKQIDVDVVVPVPDMSALGATTGDLTGKAAGEVARTSIWPHVEERVVDLIELAPLDDRVRQFPPARRAADRAAQRDPRRAAGRPRPPRGGRAAGPAAQVMAQSGTAVGAPPVLAKAHHGSVSREQRALIEDELKTGLLPAVVATSSLELGIDMGAVDLVIQVESPPSVASGLQRIGRAGHQVGAPSHGVMFPKFRGDLISAAVVAGRMQVGAHRVAVGDRATRWTSPPSRSSRSARWTRSPSTTCSSCCAGRRRSPRWAAARWNRCWTCCPAVTPASSSPSCGPG